MFWHRLRAWWHDPERAEQQAARAAIDDLFDHADRLRGTSLQSKHRNRVMYLRHEVQGGVITSVSFGIIRHPRPYAFSRQFHEVLETWTYDLAHQTVRRTQGVNLSRLSGSDGKPAGFGPDF